MLMIDRFHLINKTELFSTFVFDVAAAASAEMNRCTSQMSVRSNWHCKRWHIASHSRSHLKGSALSNMENVRYLKIIVYSNWILRLPPQIISLLWPPLVATMVCFPHLCTCFHFPSTYFWYEKRHFSQNHTKKCHCIIKWLPTTF